MPLSPNMNLPIPVPSQTGGPQYAQDEVSCFQQIDSHNHSPGQGTPIPLNGLDVNQDLDMNGLSIINLKSLELQNQVSSPGSASIYMLGDDLYFSDGSGSYDVQITLDGSVAVSGAVGFSGLPSGTASAAFLPLDATFRFQSATNTGATMDTGPLKIRNTTASSNSVTISPPAPLAASYDLTFPSALPASDSFLVSSSAGALSFQSTAFVLPAGVMMAYGGTSAPTGWLFCDGTVVAQASYANLYAVLGNNFDIGGEGAGNFRLPDMRSKSPVGAGAGTFVIEIVSIASVGGLIPLSGLPAYDFLRTGTQVEITNESGYGGFANGTYWVWRSSTAIGFSSTSAAAAAQAVLNVTVTGTGSCTITVNLTSNSLGAFGGNESNNLTDAQLPRHNHAGNTGSNTVNWDYYVGTGFDNPFIPVQKQRAGGPTNVQLAGSSHNHTIPYQGDNSQVTNKSPFLAVNYIIKY